MSLRMGCIIAVIFIWLGMIMAISFMEAPLKFRAPGVPAHFCLRIGRVVFRALNTVEATLAAILLMTLWACHLPVNILALVGITIGILLLQLTVIGPKLHHQSNIVLDAKDISTRTRSRSHLHYAYVGLEILKATALLSSGTLLLQLILTHSPSGVLPT